MNDGLAVGATQDLADGAFDAIEVIAIATGHRAAITPVECVQPFRFIRLWMPRRAVARHVSE